MHLTQTMITWYVDSGASNHMTGHKEWFERLEKIERPGYVEMGDNTKHPIEHIGWILIFVNEGEVKYMDNVFHVPNIAKNVVIFDQMVEHGMKVKFNESGCFIE